MARIDGESRSMLAAAAKRFVEDEVARAGGHEKRFQQRRWAQMAELGWLGLCVGEEFGGLGERAGSLAPIAETLGAGNLPEPLTAVAGVAAPLLALAAGRSEAAARLGRVLAGQEIVTLAHHEPAGGHDRDSVAATAAWSGDGWLLSGVKWAVEAGDAAQSFLVSAREKEATSLFLIERDRRGVSVETYRAIDGRMLAKLCLDRAAVGRENLILREADAAIDAALDCGALLTMAEAVGAMQALLDDTLDYLRQRQQFGKPLANFQALQHRAVDMFIAAEEARAMVEAAAALTDAEPARRARAIASAKFVGSRSARLIGREAVQMHGGVGITEALRVSHLFRRLLAAENAYGDADFYLDRFRRMAAPPGEPVRASTGAAVHEPV